MSNQKNSQGPSSKKIFEFSSQQKSQQYQNDEKQFVDNNHQSSKSIQNSLNFNTSQNISQISKEQTDQRRQQINCNPPSNQSQQSIEIEQQQVPEELDQRNQYNQSNISQNAKILGPQQQAKDLIQIHSASKQFFDELKKQLIEIGNSNQKLITNQFNRFSTDLLEDRAKIEQEQNEYITQLQKENSKKNIIELPFPNPYEKVLEIAGKRLRDIAGKSIDTLKKIRLTQFNDIYSKFRSQQFNEVEIRKIIDKKIKDQEENNQLRDNIRQQERRYRFKKEDVTEQNFIECKNKFHYLDILISEHLKKNSLPLFSQLSTLPASAKFSLRYSIDMRKEFNQLDRGQWLATRNIDYFICYLLEKQRYKSKEKQRLFKIANFIIRFHQIYQPNFVSAMGNLQEINFQSVIQTIGSIKKQNNKDFLSKFQNLCFIVNVNTNHWISAAYVNDGSIYYFDSCAPSYSRTYASPVQFGIETLIQEDWKTGQPPPKDQQNLTKKQIDVPQQMNGYDCGVYCCYNVMKLIERSPGTDIKKALSSDSEIINIFRKRLYYIAIYLESLPKKPYNRLILEYLDGSGPEIDVKYGFLFQTEQKQ